MLKLNEVYLFWIGIIIRWETWSSGSSSAFSDNRCVCFFITTTWWTAKDQCHETTVQNWLSSNTYGLVHWYGGSDAKTKIVFEPLKKKRKLELLYLQNFGRDEPFWVLKSRCRSLFWSWSALVFNPIKKSRSRHWILVWCKEISKKKLL